MGPPRCVCGIPKALKSLGLLLLKASEPAGLQSQASVCDSPSFDPLGEGTVGARQAEVPVGCLREPSRRLVLPLLKGKLCRPELRREILAEGADCPFYLPIAPVHEDAILALHLGRLPQITVLPLPANIFLLSMSVTPIYPHVFLTTHKALLNTSLISVFTTT